MAGRAVEFFNVRANFFTAFFREVDGILKLDAKTCKTLKCLKIDLIDPKILIDVLMVYLKPYKLKKF